MTKEQERVIDKGVARADLRLAIRVESFELRKATCADDFSESELRWLAAFREEHK